MVHVTCSKQTCRMNLEMKKRRVTFHTYVTRGNSWMDHTVLRFIATQPAQYESADDENRKGVIYVNSHNIWMAWLKMLLHTILQIITMITPAEVMVICILA